VIYDSRVAGALAWFVAAWAGERPVPASLRFPCMAAKEDPGAARRKLRNPRPGPGGFPLLGARPRAHAKWNLRASWILQALLEANPGTVFGSGTAASRRLEAALFMWGYDLTPSTAAGAAPLALRAACPRLA
jgi:glycine cleavage system aminomethyltransferase T